MLHYDMIHVVLFLSWMDSNKTYDNYSAVMEQSNKS